MQNMSRPGRNIGALHAKHVMAGLAPAIFCRTDLDEMAGSSPATTIERAPRASPRCRARKNPPG